MQKTDIQNLCKLLNQFQTKKKDQLNEIKRKWAEIDGYKFEDESFEDFDEELVEMDVNFYARRLKSNSLENWFYQLVLDQWGEQACALIDKDDLML